MRHKDDRVKEAEVFVRKALAQVSDAPVDDASVKAAAKKVSAAVPPYGKLAIKREQAAA
jgi:hypothetical protein